MNALDAHENSGGSAAEPGRKLINDVGQSYGEFGVGMMLLGSARSASGFMEQLLKNVKTSLESGKRFHGSYEYNAMGTRFFKTSVEVKPLGGKYILELCAAYVGTKPEEELASRLKKPLALISASADAKLSLVDGSWFNVDLTESLSALLTTEQIAAIASYMGNRSGFVSEPEIVLKHGGQKFNLSVGIEKPDCDYDRGVEMQVRIADGHVTLVGGAWTTWAEDRNTKIPPTPKEANLIVSVALPGKRYDSPPAIAPEQMQAMLAARDYVASLIPVAK